MSAVKRPRDTGDVLAEMKRDLFQLKTSRRIPQDVKLNFIRTIVESTAFADSVTGNPNKAEISESVAYADSLTSLTCTTGAFTVESGTCPFKMNFADFG